ncbi:MAG: phosphatase PAP2 family protein [Gemmatimonadota bacterium]
MLRLQLATLVLGCVTCVRGAEAQGVVVSGVSLPRSTADSAGLQRESVLRDGRRIGSGAQLLAPMREPQAKSMLLVRNDPRFVRSLMIAAGASAVVSLGDGPMMREIAKLRSTGGAGQKASVVCAALGGIVPLSVGAIMWAGGAVTHDDVVQNLGVESTQAVLLSGALTIGIKGLIGRTRPNASPDDPDQYYPGRGFFNASRASFPSGHTSAAFAVATVLSKEMSARFPRQKWLIRGALYGAAGSVGLARMYQNAHWPSDVVTGAALGTLSGLKVLSWNGSSR